MTIHGPPTRSRFSFKYAIARLFATHKPNAIIAKRKTSDMPAAQLE